jgi:hypothetical protein
MRKLLLSLSASVLVAVFSGALHAQNAATVTVPPSAAATFTWGLSPQSQCRIKPDPAGCTMRAQIVLDPCVQRAVSATLTVTVSYAENGRNDTQTTTKSWSGNACQVDLVEDAGGRILGGNVSGVATVRLSNGVTHSDRKVDTYWGNNPATKDVRTLIANPTYAAVAYDRSRFRQFDASGRPVFNKGFGVMLLPAPDAEQVWHWRRNVADGKARLDAAWAGARMWPDKMRKNGYPRLPDFSGNELRLFALQSLVGELYFVPNTNGRQWIPNPKRSDYADRLAKIEDAVAAGKPPADW